MMKFWQRVNKILTYFNRNGKIEDLEEQIEKLKILSAKSLIDQMKNTGIMRNISEAEWSVFSQFGDDGIIQYLIHLIEIPMSSQTFIEFGVQNYEESNTRFLLLNNNWRGLIFDSENSNISSIVHSWYYWRHDLKAVSAFLNRENANHLFLKHGFSGEIGILSIDIDGNDYWVWECIDAVEPLIVIVEYNSVFGATCAVTIPYDPDFQRNRAHYSNLYWGASLKALCVLADCKGYAFVGSNSAGNNAYFVRRDKVGILKSIDASTGYVEAKFRESRSPTGKLTYLTGNDRLQAISHLDLYDIQNEKTIKVGDLY